MRSLISIIFLTLFLTNCGFKPIYNSKDSNFEIIEIENKNENKNSFFITDFNMVDGYKSKKSNKENTLTHLFSKYDTNYVHISGKKFHSDFLKWLSEPI